MSEFEKFWQSTHWIQCEEHEAIARAAWNAALDAAKAKMPEAWVGPRWSPQDHSTAGGWNHCLSVTDERLDALKEPR